MPKRRRETEESDPDEGTPPVVEEPTAGHECGATICIPDQPKYTRVFVNQVIESANRSLKTHIAPVEKGKDMTFDEVKEYLGGQGCGCTKILKG